ncbi:hypothetical protein CUR65_12345 [Salmonella enterica subsp. enterica serovar Legon]|uniref:hypothetical protein n=1 Tax=Salmonella enterica TaxID=28901 RepID=UPI000D3EC401|nr:hypothetical protein [Salmonella enterica]PVB80437.1 hypothetical protein CUR58_03500 [Salmonella enterica subsp. enterica serovar Legon]PVB87734.1 hypothetical protein CUR65_12345 [Salmonella enterica subsp. enterica serovar Legon]PVB96170.1 hypothetical protein CUR66_03510 [Salmonella enterica subsp. enterica serovar Legon]PVC04049.1 hypothetical protein CUR73_03505 [Salmonella enterica subsp. enterica serovar Legon]PVC10520.1 hypothetical protein CUR74_03505 [Salmonella enterica subsp. e
MTNNKLTDETLSAWKMEAKISLGETAKDSQDYSHHEAILALVTELQERRKAEVPGYPETLPCPVFLEPGLKFDKGVRTQLVLYALRCRADYYAELGGMTAEQRADHDAGIAEFKAMLQGSQPVSNRDELPCTQLPCIRWCCRDFG